MSRILDKLKQAEAQRKRILAARGPEHRSAARPPKTAPAPAFIATHAVEETAVREALVRAEAETEARLAAERKAVAEAEAARLAERRRQAEEQAGSEAAKRRGHERAGLAEAEARPGH